MLNVYCIILICIDILSSLFPPCGLYQHKYYANMELPLGPCPHNLLEVESSAMTTRTSYPLVICYIAIEHGPFIVDLPIKDGDFP